jgi:hypothetical protein
MRARTTIRVPENRLFHDAWNSSQSGLRGALPQLQRILPTGWSVQGGPGRSAREPSLLLRAPDGRVVRLAVIARSRFEPRDVAGATTRSVAGLARGPLLIAAPFLSERTRTLLAAAGASYADATGNVRLAGARPAIFVERLGAQRDPSSRKHPLLSLRGPAARRIVEVLEAGPLPSGVRELASRSGISPASVSRVFGLLEREALVVRDARGRVVELDGLPPSRHHDDLLLSIASPEAMARVLVRSGGSWSRRFATWRGHSMVVRESSP